MTIYYISCIYITHVCIIYIWVHHVYDHIYYICNYMCVIIHIVHICIICVMCVLYYIYYTCYIYYIYSHIYIKGADNARQFNPYKKPLIYYPQFTDNKTYIHQPWDQLQRRNGKPQSQSFSNCKAHGLCTISAFDRE